MYQTDINQATLLFQLNKLEEHIQNISSKLRWLWMTNLTAAIVCILMHKYKGAAFTGISWIVSLSGAAILRKVKRILNNSIMQCRNDLK